MFWRRQLFAVRIDYKNIHITSNRQLTYTLYFYNKVSHGD